MSSNVCENQQVFNQAVRTAAENYEESQCQTSACRTRTAMIAIIFLVFFFWAIILAMKADKQHRVLHLVFAMMFSPVYVLSHYLDLYLEAME